MTDPLAFGLYLPNRSIVLGDATVPELLALAAAADREPLFDSVWIGDAMLINRRLDAVPLLGALAARTERVLLGPACMGSFAVRNPITFACEWASLDVISGGRMRLVACVGGGGPDAYAAECAAFGFDAKEKRRRMFEQMSILRRLWTGEAVTHHGRFFRFDEVTVEPRPVQQPCPIWMATNTSRLASGRLEQTARGPRQVAEHADGWMTHSASPDGFRQSWAAILELAEQEFGREVGGFDNLLYLNVNVNDDEATAVAEAKGHLDRYYGADFTEARVRAWGAYGPPGKIAEALAAYRGTGCRRLAFRLAGPEPARIFERLVTEVLPGVNA